MHPIKFSRNIESAERSQYWQSGCTIFIIGFKSDLPWIDLKHHGAREAVRGAANAFRAFDILLPLKFFGVYINRREEAVSR